MSKPFSIYDRLRSFVVAFNGISVTLRTEHNFIIHIFLAIFAIALGFCLQISSLEWVAIVIVISMVLAAELINTSIEIIVDMVSPERNKQAGIIKDIAAGAVLITAIGALITGLIIFGPKLLELI